MSTKFNTMNNVLIIYHRSDNDGLLSAAIFNKYFERKTGYNIRFYGAEYSDLLRVWTNHLDYVEDIEYLKESGNQYTGRKSIFQSWMDNNDIIVMVDISFNNTDAMNRIFKEKGDSFIWCDHHAPIIKESEHCDFGKASGIRRTDQSAILCSWQYCFSEFEVPKEFVMLSDYDSWQWVNKPEYQNESEQRELFAFNTGVTRVSNLKINWFNEFVHNAIRNSGSMWCMDTYQSIVEKCRTHGRIIYDYDNERTDRAIKSHGDITWTINGELACAVFTTDRFNSQSFKCFKGTDIHHGLVFKRNPTGSWTMSAYNVSEEESLHCGDYLKEKYNGGGHKGAGGCVLSERQFISILQSHSV